MPADLPPTNFELRLRDLEFLEMTNQEFNIFGNKQILLNRRTYNVLVFFSFIRGIMIKKMNKLIGGVWNFIPV